MTSRIATVVTFSSITVLLGAACGKTSGPDQTVVTSPVRGTTPEQVAKQMVDAIDDVTFSSSSSLGRSNSIPKAQRDAATKDLDVAYSRATGENMANASMQVQMRYVLALTKLLGRRRLYNNGVFQPAEATRYAARLGSLDKGILAQWRTALAKISGESLETGPVALALLSVERLFEDASVTPGTSERMLSRLSSLEPNSISRWQKTLGADNIDLTFAALSLLSADGLFVADRFQADAFGKAVPIAERLIGEVKRK